MVLLVLLVLMVHQVLQVHKDYLVQMVSQDLLHKRDLPDLVVILGQLERVGLQGQMVSRVRRVNQDPMETLAFLVPLVLQVKMVPLGPMVHRVRMVKQDNQEVRDQQDG